MIVGNVIKFGYGDIAIFSSQQGWVDFINIKPPQLCGENLLEVEGVEYGLKIRIEEDDLFDFLKVMKTVNEDNRVVEYKGYVFDFTNYNQRSVNSAIKGARNMFNSLPYAC